MPARVENFLDPERLSLLAKVDKLDGQQEHLAAWFSKFPLRFSVTANLLWRALHIRALNQRNRTAQELEAYTGQASSTAIPCFRPAGASCVRKVWTSWI